MKLLSELGWNVIVIWECELKEQHFSTTMDILVAHLQNIAKDKKNK